METLLWICLSTVFFIAVTAMKAVWRLQARVRELEDKINKGAHI